MLDFPAVFRSASSKQDGAENPTLVATNVRCLDRLVSFAFRLLAMASLLGLAACTTLGGALVPNPVPQNLIRSATVQNGAGSAAPIRFWADTNGKGGDAGYIETQIRRQLPQIAATGRLDMLALSGGGFNGTFGVGYLTGWSARGDRPQFRIVTGISVGALIAPFAFLGKDYDEELMRAFAQVSTESMNSRPGMIPLLFGAEAVASNAPLKKGIATIITDETLARIGEEHKRGRRLLIGTTNLDAQRPVVWDIGAIANSNIPNKVELVRQILLASAALPGIYPPVLIPVEAKGKPYTELHVDGGVTQQVVLLPNHRYAGELTRPLKAHIYVVYDDQLEPAYAPPKPSFSGILLKAIPTLLKYQGLSDIARLRQFAKTNNAGFSLVAIPPDFPVETDFPPKADYLNALFDLGHKLGKQGSWGN